MFQEMNRKDNILNILIENETNENLKSFYDDINLVIKNTLDYENFTDNAEVSITFVDNKEIKELNNKFRKINKETDVLSFPLLDDFENIDQNSCVFLGDIVISVEKAIDQADAYGHSLRREITFLVIHSMLHLLGYDHMACEEEKEMIFKQKEIFKLSNIGKEIIE